MDVAAQTARGADGTPRPVLYLTGEESAAQVKKRAEPVWDPGVHEKSWRAVWAYSKKRAARDNQTLTAQANRARAIRRRREAPQGHAFCHHPRR